MMKQQQQELIFSDEPDVSTGMRDVKGRALTPLNIFVNDTRSQVSDSELASPFYPASGVFDDLFDDNLIDETDLSLLFDNVTNDSSFSSSENKDASSNSTVDEFVCGSSQGVRTMTLPQPLVVSTPLNQSKIGESSFQCQAEGCSEVFGDKSALKKHAKLHRERSFVCEFDGCHKGFFEKSKLKRHQAVHTKEKKLACPECGKLFGLKWNVTAHLRTHTGEKPFKCSEAGCDKSFAQDSNRKAHEKIHLKRKRGCSVTGSSDSVAEPDVSMPSAKRQRMPDCFDAFDVLSEL